MIKIGPRGLDAYAREALRWGNYRAVLNMPRTYGRFWEPARRYFTGGGTYPYRVDVRTPLGTVRPTLHSFHDLLTLNEIFCRHDYELPHDARHVVDVGSNIGLSALYFLTRNTETRCLLFEPDPRNVAKLRQTLAGFEARYELVEEAVWTVDGELAFHVEETGRYGGIGVATADAIQVRCRHVDRVIEHALERFPRIDLLKIDTEGVEEETVRAISPRFYERIGRIYLESLPDADLLEPRFRNAQYVSIRRLINRDMRTA